jgi:hypothetical protein
MLLLLHILFAAASIVGASIALVRPSMNKLLAGYGLTGLTLFSGSILVIVSHAKLASACMSGLLYVSGIALALGLARRRLAHEAVRSPDSKE